MKSNFRTYMVPTALILVFGLGFSLYASARESKKSENPGIGKLTNEERIVRAGVHLRNLEGKPLDVSKALISFDQLKNKEFVKSLISNKNLKVKQVYFTISVNGGPTTRGGFIPENGIETSFADSENHLVASLKVANESMQRMVSEKPQFEVETEKDREYIKAYEMAEKTLRQNEERLTKVRQNIGIYNGIQVEIQNDKVKELVNTPGIRAIEIVSDKFDIKASPMLPEGITSFTQ